MPIRIESQSAMQRVKSSVTFCYLCESDLPHGKAGTSVEHLVPTGRLPKLDDRDLWPVTLRVHAHCDRDEKQRNDNLLTLTERVHLHGLGSLNGSQFQTLANQMRLGDEMGVPADVPGIMATEVYAAIWQSIRGFHAVLYSEPLSANTKRVTIAPVPSFNLRSDQPIADQVQREQWFNDHILTAVGAAIDGDEWDGVTAWAGTLKYRCVWFNTRVDRVAWDHCYWVLDTPGAVEWAETVSGEARPWNGVYRIPSAPTGASFLSDRAIETHNARRKSIRLRHRLRELIRRAGSSS